MRIVKGIELKDPHNVPVEVALFDPIESLGGRVDLVVILAIGKGFHLANILSEPFRILGQKDETILDKTAGGVHAHDLILTRGRLVAFDDINSLVTKLLDQLRSGSSIFNQDRRCLPQPRLLNHGAVHQKPRLRVAGKFMLRALGLFNPFLREVVEMHYLWTTPVKLDDTRLRQLLSILHKTPYAEGIRATIEAGTQTDHAAG